MTVSTSALGPACNPAGKAAHPWLCGHANTMGPWRLLGLRGKHPSQPRVREGTALAAPVVGRIVCGSVMWMPEQPPSSPHGAGGLGRAGTWAGAAGRVSLSGALKSSRSAWKESLKTSGPPGPPGSLLGTNGTGGYLAGEPQAGRHARPAVPILPALIDLDLQH